MKILTRLQRHCAWMNMSTATLIALLQRTPVVRLAVAVDEMVSASPVGALIKSAAAAVAALGAVDSMAGATLLASTLDANPTGPLPVFNATVGKPITEVAFTITNTENIGSWKISGQFPPGLVLHAAENSALFLTGPGNLDATTAASASGWGTTSANTTTTPDLEGTPTTAGTFTIMMQGFAGGNEQPGTVTMGSGISDIFPFTIVVAPAAAAPPPPPAGAPAFTTQPISVTVAGGTVALYAVASNSPTYQWMNGSSPVAGATSSILELSNAAAAVGTYTCVATNSIGSATSNPASVAVTSTSDIGRLINLSTRAQVGTGGNILIAGFAIGGGSGNESLLARASGPALVPLGVTGTLADPQLQLFNGTTVLATNNGWAGDPTITAEAAAVGAFAWSTPSSHDSAIATQLGTGSYTAQVAGQSNDTGVALAEVYDATPAGSFTPSSPRLVNLSARVMVGTGGNILIAGFVVGGSTSATVLIRASGPALTGFGVAGALTDPELTLSSGSTTLATNDGWGGDPQIAAAAAAVGAFSWGAAATPDSAILVTLPPGAYTAQVAGASGDTGVSLVEVYEVQ
jgi:hypothetical protein